MVEQYVRLSRLEPVHFLDDRVVLCGVRAFEYRRFVVAEPVVVMVEAINLSEPQVDWVPFLVPILRDRPPVPGAQNHLAGCCLHRQNTLLSDSWDGSLV